MKSEVYQIVTDQILAKLKEGTIPWKHFALHPMARPRNLITNKPYRGINLFLLSGSPFASHYWLTYNQAEELGGHVKKGEKSTIVVFWKQLEVENKETGEVKEIPMLRYYRVFNLEQTEGCDSKRIREAQIAYADRNGSNPIEHAERIVSEMPNPPHIDIDDRPAAFYSPASDKVHMLRREQCVNDEAFYETLLHELVHSTGHMSRLNRNQEMGGWHAFGSKTYAQEELIAEMGAAFLCAEAEIFQQQLDNSAAYIAGWLKALKNDVQMVVKAAGKAQKAADYILNVSASPERSMAMPA
jgi:antirestriction protein ArdC